MAQDETPGADSVAEDELRRAARALADGIEAALPGWVTTQVKQMLVAYLGKADPATMQHAVSAGELARREIGSQIRDLLEADVDAQRSNPLSVLRGAARFPTRVLRDAGVPPVVRDRFSEERFPEDIYDLGPATFADLDPSLHDLGLRWGAAKAFVHRARHR